MARQGPHGGRRFEKGAAMPLILKLQPAKNSLSACSEVTHSKQRGATKTRSIKI